MSIVADTGHQQATIGETAEDWKVPKDPTDRRNVIDGCRKQGLEADWKAGKCLLAQKNELGHGNFMDWYEDCGYDKDWVSKRIKLVENYPDQISLRAKFATMTEALDALKKPKKDRKPSPPREETAAAAAKRADEAEGQLRRAKAKHKEEMQISRSETNFYVTKYNDAEAKIKKAKYNPPKVPKASGNPWDNEPLPPNPGGSATWPQGASAAGEKDCDWIVRLRHGVPGRWATPCHEVISDLQKQIDGMFLSLSREHKAKHQAGQAVGELSDVHQGLKEELHEIRDGVDTWKRRAELAKAECDRLRERCEVSPAG